MFLRVAGYQPAQGSGSGSWKLHPSAVDHTGPTGGSCPAAPTAVVSEVRGTPGGCAWNEGSRALELPGRMLELKVPTVLSLRYEDMSNIKLTGLPDRFTCNPGYLGGQSSPDKRLLIWLTPLKQN